MASNVRLYDTDVNGRDKYHLRETLSKDIEGGRRYMC